MMNLGCTWMKYFLAMIALSMISAPVHAQEVIIGPSFGFSWGANFADVRKSYPNATVEKDGDLTVLRIVGASSPNLPSDTDFLSLLFTDKFGLIKQFWTSTNFAGDIYGSEGKEKFETLYEALSRRLGEGREFQYVGAELYRESDEFYECLGYEGCGAWVVFWRGTESDESIATLQLEGVSRGNGYLAYSVEHPNWYVRGREATSSDVSKF